MPAVVNLVGEDNGDEYVEHGDGENKDEQDEDGSADPSCRLKSLLLFRYVASLFTHCLTRWMTTDYVTSFNVRDPIPPAKHDMDLE